MNDEVASILIMHLLLYVSIGLDIPILRQCIGFIFITFIPGFVILRVLTQKNRNALETFLLSVGLSIAFSMFIGLFMNGLYPILGVTKPLSTGPLTITLTSLTLMIFLVGYRKDILAGVSVHDHFAIRLSIRHIPLLVATVILLLASIIGALYVNILVLLLTIIGIALLYAASVLSDKLVPSRWHPFLVLLISMSLLFQVSLISRHIMGWDIHEEYYVFKLTETQGYWKAPGTVLPYSSDDVINSVLSTTILPTIYSTVLNLDGEITFKVVIPFIFSLVPLVLYRILELQSGKRIALLSTFFFVSSSTSFYSLESLSLIRQMVAELFLALLILSLVHENLSLRNKRIFLMVFGASLVVSHYSLSFIYIFYIALTFIILRIRGKKKTLNLAIILFTVAITFSWYIYVSTPPLNNLIDIFHNIAERFTSDILDPQARLAPGYTPLSPLVQTNIVGWTHKILIYITHFFIVFGIIVLIVKPRKFGLNPEFQLMGILSGVILGLCFGVPNFASAFGLSRFYKVIMIFLTVLFTLGGLYFLDLVGKFVHHLFGRLKIQRRDLKLYILTATLIAFFLFEVGFANHVTGGFPSSYSLDLNRKKTYYDINEVLDFYRLYVTEEEFMGAKWLVKYMDNTLPVYADSKPYYKILHPLFLLPREQIDDLYRNMTFTQNSYAYLNYMNTHMGVIEPRGTITYLGSLFNASEIDFLQNDKIYSNGDSDIYYAP